MRKTLAVRIVDAACRLIPERLPTPELLPYFPTDEDGHLSHAAFLLLWAAAPPPDE